MITILVLANLSFNSFAAVVSDNDGAAFITKSEFDSLRSDFLKTLGEYNSNIDTKINDAIQGYINGLKDSKREVTATLSPGDWECVSERYNSSDYTWRFKYGSPRIAVTLHYTGKAYTGQGDMTSYRGTLDYPAFDSSKHSIHKLLIQDVSETNKVAKWVGIGYGCKDDIVSYAVSWGTPLAVGGSGSVNKYMTYFRPNGEVSNGALVGRPITNIGIGDANGGINFEFTPSITSFVQNFGTIKNDKIILLSGNRKYQNFSLYPESRNWGFWTTDTSAAYSYEKLWTATGSVNLNMSNEIKNCYGVATSSSAWDYVNVNGTGKTTMSGRFDFGNKFSNHSEAWGTSRDSKKNCCWPCVGFESSYITNWNQLYTTYYDTVADDVASTTWRSALLKDDNDIYHVGIYNGVPLLKTTKNNTTVTLDLKLTNKTYNIQTGAVTTSKPTTDCYVWLSDRPFINYPNNDVCLDFTPVDNTCEHTTATNFTKAIKIPASREGVATVKFVVPTIGSYVWVKWSTDANYGGGVLTIPSRVITET